MFDATPLSLEEIADQCRALTHALIELENPIAKEIITFVLAEQLDHLHVSLDSPYNSDKEGEAEILPVKG